MLRERQEKLFLHFLLLMWTHSLWALGLLKILLRISWVYQLMMGASSLKAHRWELLLYFFKAFLRYPGLYISVSIFESKQLHYLITCISSGFGSFILITWLYTRSKVCHLLSLFFPTRNKNSDFVSLQKLLCSISF